ncbi:hypothetical protein CKA32_000662 [Geitlerinema sp. FC II]|nr:hypothetical protein CKA32_000662 [Geitlerinema sp. FC II]
MFQSLEGIFGFFNVLANPSMVQVSVVSIPRRDFWVFQPGSFGTTICA